MALTAEPLLCYSSEGSGDPLAANADLKGTGSLRVDLLAGLFFFLQSCTKRFHFILEKEKKGVSFALHVMQYTTLCIKSSLAVSTQGFFFCSLWSRNSELNIVLRYSNKSIDSEKCLQVLFVVIFTTDFCSIWHILQCSILISLNSFLQCKEAIYVCKIVISSQSIRKCLLSIPFIFEAMKF